MIRAATLGFAIAEVDHGVREEGGNNRGPRVDDYLANTDPPIHTAAPWCAAFVQYVSDVVCNFLGAGNPLDMVRLEAYVQSYYDWASEGGKLVAPDAAEPGDLVLFSFGGERYDHVGFLLAVPNADGTFPTIEGNTGDRSARDGDGVFRKIRTHLGSYGVRFVRWAP